MKNKQLTLLTPHLVIQKTNSFAQIDTFDLPGETISMGDQLERSNVVTWQIIRFISQ
jgi:hypothetical protein